MVYVTYTPFYENYHDEDSMITGRYFCDILDFNTGIWWSCYDDNRTQLIVIPEKFYSVAPYPKVGKKANKMMKDSEKIVSMLYINNMLLYHKFTHWLCSTLFTMKNNIKYIMEEFNHFKDDFWKTRLICKEIK